MKLKPVAKKPVTSKPEVDKTASNEGAVKTLTENINVLTFQINELTKQREDAVKQKFYLENAPYKNGDEVIVRVRTGKNEVEVKAILMYESSYINPCFYAVPYKKDGELSSTRRQIYKLDQILRYADK
jgi:hypothetical protein